MANIYVCNSLYNRRMALAVRFEKHKKYSQDRLSNQLSLVGIQSNLYNLVVDTDATITNIPVFFYSKNRFLQVKNGSKF